MRTPPRNAFRAGDVANAKALIDGDFDVLPELSSRAWAARKARGEV